MDDLGVNKDMDKEEDMVMDKEDKYIVTTIQTMKKEVIYHQELVKEQQEEVVVIFKMKEGRRNLKYCYNYTNLVIFLRNVILMTWKKKLILLMKRRANFVIKTKR